MKKKQKKLVKTAFWAVILMLVLFFGRRMLPGDEAGVEGENDVSGNEGTVGYRENDGEEIHRGVTVVSRGGEQYVEAAASGSWGLGFGADGSETQPSGSLSREELAKYDAWYLGDDSEKILYLTFDCGYENGNTEKILDALKKHNAKGTFFVVGHFLESAPELVKRMQQEGHTVGNHTWHHYDMDTIAEEGKFREELDTVADKYREIFWSLAYVDWNVDAQPSREEAMAKLTGRVHPGAVVLLHNTSKTNGEILDELLTKWEEMGYRFGTLEELTS